MSDEEIQKRFDSGLPPASEDRDVAAYREIFRAISKEPALKISSTFAEGVVKKIMTQKKREARRDMIWLSFGVAFLLIGLMVTGAFAGLQSQLGFLRDISGFAGIFIFGTVVIFAFNWLEKKLISKQFS